MPDEATQLYDVEVYSGKTLLGVITVSALSREDASNVAIQDINVKIKKAGTNMLEPREIDKLVKDEEIKRIREFVLRGEFEVPNKGFPIFTAKALAEYLHGLEKRIEALEAKKKIKRAYT